MTFLEIKNQYENKEENSIILLIFALMSVFALFIFSIFHNANDSLLIVNNNYSGSSLSHQEDNKNNIDEEILSNEEISNYSNDDQIIRGKFKDSLNRLLNDNIISAENIIKLNSTINNFYDISKLHQSNSLISFDDETNKSIQNIKLQIDNFRYLEIEKDSQNNYKVNQVFKDKNSADPENISSNKNPELLSAAYRQGKSSTINLNQIKDYSIITKEIKIKDGINFLRNIPIKTLLDFNVKAGKSKQESIILTTLLHNTTNGKKEVVYFSLSNGRKKIKYYLSNGSYYTKNGIGTKKISIFGSPLDGRLIVNSKFGLRRHPILLYTRMHTGVDLKARFGAPIYSVGEGVIEFIGTKRGYGKYVVIKHQSGYRSGYGHLSSFAKNLRPGVKIKKGQRIGSVGASGIASAPHLHFEIMNKGTFVNPMGQSVTAMQKIDYKNVKSFNKTVSNIENILSRVSKA